MPPQTLSRASRPLIQSCRSTASRWISSSASATDGALEDAERVGDRLERRQPARARLVAQAVGRHQARAARQAQGTSPRPGTRRRARMACDQVPSGTTRVIGAGCRARRSAGPPPGGETAAPAGPPGRASRAPAARPPVALPGFAPPAAAAPSQAPAHRQLAVGQAAQGEPARCWWACAPRAGAAATPPGSASAG